MTRFADGGSSLLIFLVLLLLSFGALIAAWARGRVWGDLSSRLHYGEALTAEEQALLKASRRSFFLRAGVSLLLLALSFYALR